MNNIINIINNIIMNNIINNVNILILMNNCFIFLNIYYNE
jgi:hypothetical protein